MKRTTIAVITFIAILAVAGCTGLGGSGGWGGQGISINADNTSHIEHVHITITDGGTDFAGGVSAFPSVPAPAKIPADEKATKED
jgi:hypothetical protein